MKKQFLLLAATATFVACSQTDNFKEVGESPIDFTNVVIEKNTKGVISQASDLYSPGFGVFGAKTVDNAASQVFGQLSSESAGGTKVTKSGSAWAYTQKRYWDKEATQYDFFAYAPYNTVTNNVPLIGTIAWNKNNPATSFSITGFKQKTTKDAMVDILTASAQRVGSTNYTNTVDFSFSHILSNIHVQMAVSQDLKDDEGANPVTVVSVSLGAIKMDGNYTYNTTDSKFEWALAGTQTTAATTFNATTSGTPAVVFPATQLTTTATDVPGLDGLLFVPQTLPSAANTEYVINVTYKIDEEQFSKTIKLNSFVKKQTGQNDVPSSEWKIGYRYNYLLIIGPTPIVFGDPTIGTWTEETYQYTIE